MRVSVQRLGSDPEFLFVNQDDDIVPAESFVVDDARSTWLGTDGHPTTGEIRPLPFRDARLHLRNIAEAVVALDDFLRKHHPDLDMIAQPVYHDEQLGGHIHVSLVLRDPSPLEYSVISSGYFYGRGEIMELPVSFRDYAHRRPVQMRAIDEYTAEATQFKTPSLKLFRAALRPIVVFEDRLFGDLRSGRDYGTGDDMFRLDRGVTVLSPTTLRLRLEYRYPSTWLYHPAVALMYLTTAKFVFANLWKARQEFSTPNLLTLSGVADIISDMMSDPETVVSEDTRPLPRLIRYVERELLHEMRHLSRLVISTDAWRKLLTRGTWKR